jgi:PAS domain S-box-containing protein
MAVANKPANEDERLKALHSYEILDSVTEQDYDELTEIAAAICGTPIALISLVDANRQWFKSRKGIEASETPIAESFCAHAILNPSELFEIEDANEDSRFRDNRLVTGSPHIKFYAGMPLLDSQGYALGSICVIDTQKRQLNETQKNALKILSRQVVSKFELRKKLIELENARDELAATELLANEVAKNLNQELRLSEERLNLAISSANLGTWHIDANTREFFPSLRMKELFGYYPEEVMTFENALNQILETHRDKVIQTFEIALQKGTNYDLEYPVIGYHDNKLRWLHATGKLFLPPENAKANYFAGTMLDITDYKLNDQRRNDFIGIVSHELRTPITSLSGYLQLLVLYAQKIGEEKILDYAIKGKRQVDRMSSLIMGFLDVARLSEGKIQLNKTRFNMADILKAAEEESLATITSHPIIYHPVEFTLVEADKDKIEQVLINFVNNAVKYSPAGREINVACVQIESRAYVNVKDSGIGIDEKDQAHVFERFYRVSNNNQKQVQGFGIGLYVCKEIIELHEGQIGVESEIGKGSNFWFSLPLCIND